MSGITAFLLAQDGMRRSKHTGKHTSIVRGLPPEARSEA